MRVGSAGCLFGPSLSFSLSFSAGLLLFTLFQEANTRSMCSILDQRAAIVGDRLFFSSGIYTFDDDLPRHSTPSLYWLYLNDTIDISGPIDVTSFGSVDLPSDSLTGGKSSDPGGAAGTFFYDHTMLYPYASLAGPAGGINNALWAFNSSDNTWKIVQVEGGNLFFANNSEGIHASDPRTRTSFYTGGWKMAYNSTFNGTVKFQSSNSYLDSPQWSFETAVSGMQGPNILKGAMVYVRKGRAGILIAFGGYQTAYEGVEFSGWPWDRRPFSEIFIYDIFSSTWYRQTAVGDLPELRTEFCAGVSSAPDNSSFQITIHGGWDQLKGRGFNDVYVLSLPSFRWIKVHDSKNPDLGHDQPGRNRHTCNVWNEASLIVTGGEILLGEGNAISLTEKCNKTYPPIKVLDTSTYIWSTEFNPHLEYAVPDIVTAVIGGNSLGGAHLTAPSAGWDSPELDAIFNQTVSRDIYDPTAPPGSNPSFESNPKPRDDSSLSSGAIVGIMVGILAAVISTLVVVFLYWRRKNRSAIDKATIKAPTTLQAEEWHKLELDGRQRHELGVESRIHEMQGDRPS